MCLQKLLKNTTNIINLIDLFHAIVLLVNILFPLVNHQKHNPFQEKSKPQNLSLQQATNFYIVVWKKLLKIWNYLPI